MVGSFDLSRSTVIIGDNEGTYLVLPPIALVFKGLSVIQASLEVKSSRTIIWQNNYIP